MAWLNNWKYRKKITITGQTGAGSNYQVKLKVGESSGASGENFDVRNRCVSFPSAKNTSGDIRFTDNDGSTLLDFWVESVTGTTPNRLATIWVEVADDLGSNVDVYCYYGGVTTNVSNGDNTFNFFDDFDDDSLDETKWNEWLSDGSYSESSDILQITGGASSAWEVIGAVTKFSTNKTFEYYAKAIEDKENMEVAIDDRSDDGTYVGSGTDNAGFKRFNDSEIKSFYSTKREGSLQKTTRTDSIANYSKLMIKWSSSDVKFYIDGTLKATHSTQVPADTCGIQFACANDDTSVWCNYCFVRAYSATEPAYSSAGNEESAGGGFFGIDF